MLAFLGQLFQSFLHLRGHFLSIFRPPGGTLGELWAHFWNQQMAWGTKHAPRLPQEAPPPFRWHPFGDILGTIFHIFCIFLVTL